MTPTRTGPPNVTPTYIATYRCVSILSDTFRSVSLRILTVSYGDDGRVEFEIEIDYEAPEPPHRQIAAWLRAKIQSGEYPPGRRIPSEKDIMDLSGVARTTARRAVALLRDEGLVVTTQGRGTHVTKRLSRSVGAASLPAPTVDRRDHSALLTGQPRRLWRAT
jgi:GntR family transcriptional regulator